MGKRRLRSITVVILLVLTVALAGAAVYVGYRVQQQESEAPEETEAAGEAEYEVRIGCASKGTCPDSDWSPDAPGSSGGTCAFHFTRTYKGDGNCKAGKTSGWIIGVDPNNIDASGYTECKSGPNPCGGGYDAYCICDKKICPYKTTEIRMQTKSGGQRYYDVEDIECGSSLIVWLTHDNSDRAKDMVVTVTDPNGDLVRPITETGQRFSTSIEGTYTLTAQTKKSETSTNYYTEDECKDTATVTCSGEAPVTECGDGILDEGEDCEVGIACADLTQTCNEETCTCSGTPITECGDGILDEGEECEVGISCETAGEICDESACTCSRVTPDVACEDLARVGTDPVGTNEVELFTLQVSGDPDEQPFSTSVVRLRVSSSADDTPVGSDYYTSEDLVAPVSAPGYNPDEEVWIYTFAWRASGLTDGTYDVEVSFDGGSSWDDTPACQLTFTFDDEEEVEPSFLIIKTATSTCSTSSGAVINYTVTVTNLGPGSGTLDYVEDDLDDGIQDSWVSNIRSSKGVTGSVSSGVVTWTGTETQRTYTQGESATFTYTVTIPASSLTTFISNGVANVATVIYGDDQDRYNLYTELTCQSGTLPSTGIIDNTPWILGTFAIILGMIAFKLGAGQQLLYPILQSSKFNFFYALGLDSFAAEKKKDELEDKFK